MKQPDMKKMDQSWTVFLTAFGFCGVSWNSRGLTSFHLPEVSEISVEKRLKKMTGTTAASSFLPSWVKGLIRKVKKHLKGDTQNFSDVPLDFDKASDFQLCVLNAARKIQSGTVVTYSELAASIKRPKAARAVGTALGRNPIPLIVPCHRVIASSGKLGGFSAPGGVKTKLKLLECEGVSQTRRAKGKI